MAEDRCGRADQRTPDLSALLQEIVDRPGWRSGNAVALILSGAGRRTARAYDGLQAGAPLLHVELTARTTRAPARRPFPHRYLFGSGDDPAAAKSVGFNLIDVGSKWHADALPDGARALLYLGTGAAWDDATCQLGSFGCDGREHGECDCERSEGGGLFLLG